MFYPGGGRPKGSLNWKTRQIQAFCRSVVEDHEYRESILDRARKNNLGSMEPVIWAYGYGRPKETVELQLAHAQEDLSGLSIEELAQRAEDLVRQLHEAQDVAKQLAPFIDITPGEVIEVRSLTGAEDHAAQREEET